MLTAILSSLPGLILCKASLGATPWIVWTVIGIVGGYMAGRLLRPDLSTALYLVVGIVGAIAGGWCYTLIFGVTDEDIYISLLSSAVVCGIFLWVASKMTPTDVSGGGSEDD